MTDVIPDAIADELRARAFGVVQAYLRQDEAAFDSLAGDDEESAVLLPVVVGLLVGAITNLVGRDELAGQVDSWLNERRHLLAG